MDIFKIIGVGLIGGILSMTVKQYKKEYALLVALATVTVILFFTLDTLETAISQISQMCIRDSLRDLCHHQRQAQ